MCLWKQKGTKKTFKPHCYLKAYLCLQVASTYCSACKNKRFPLPITVCHNLVMCLLTFSPVLFFFLMQCQERNHLSFLAVIVYILKYKWVHQWPEFCSELLSYIVHCPPTSLLYIFFTMYERWYKCLTKANNQSLNYIHKYIFLL